MRNEEIFAKSNEYMPGGVNSPVRAYRDMGINPPVMKCGKGVIIKDEDGKEYIDFVLAWGPMILGHCNDEVVTAIKEISESAIAFGAPTELELQMARFLCEEMDNVEMVRMVNSGTEATMSAIKLARGYTKKNKIIKFAGCYHGHFDGFLVEAGSGVLTEGIAGSLGIPQDSIKNTLIGVYNDAEQVRGLFEAYGDDIAAVIIEPVAGNMGVIKADNEFMETLRILCDEYGALLVFDEVMSGFRVAFKGAQELFNVRPDLITYAKIMGGGLPAGVYGGRKEIMEKNNVEEHNKLFIKSNGQPITSTDAIDYWKDSWSEILGIDFYFHSARHYLCTLLSKIGLEQDLIIEIYGWSSGGEMYKIYNDLTAKDRQWKGTAKLKDALENNIIIN